MAFDVSKYIIKPAPKPKAVTPAITAAATTKPAETKPAETKPAETKPAETKPTVTYTPGANPNGGMADGHLQNQLVMSSVTGTGQSAESEDEDAKARRDLWTYGMKLSMDRMFDIDKENRAQARKIQSAGWKMVGGRIVYNNARSQGYTSSPTDFASMIKPFDAPAKTTTPSGTSVGIQNWDVFHNWDGVSHNPDQGKYLASTSKAMLGMDSLQKFVTTDKNGVKSFTADAFDKAWNSLSAKQKDEVTGSYEKANVTHASAMEGNPHAHAPAIVVLGEGQRFAPGAGGNGRPGTIMTVARTADGKTLDSRYFDERNRGADVTLSAKTTNEVLSSDQARNGNLAGAMDAIRSGLEQRNADEAVSSARKKLDEEMERVAASFD